MSRVMSSRAPSCTMTVTADMRISQVPTMFVCENLRRNVQNVWWSMVKYFIISGLQRQTLYGSSTLASKSRAIFCRRWLRRHYGWDFSLSFCPNAYRPRPSLIIYSVTWFMDRFIPWAVLDVWVGVLDVAVGRFGSCHGLFWTYQKFIGHFGRGHFGSWAVLV